MINREMPVEDKWRVSFKEQSSCITRTHALAKSTPSYKPQPCTYKAPESSVVDRVLLCANETEQFLVKVMVRQCRRPEVGDKFASRHGQKGVCGAIVSQVFEVHPLSHGPSASTALSAQFLDHIHRNQGTFHRKICQFQILVFAQM
jgi:hypothetical protein